MVDRFLSEQAQADGTVTLKKPPCPTRARGSELRGTASGPSRLKLAVEERSGRCGLANRWKEGIAWPPGQEQNDRINGCIPSSAVKAAEYQFLDPETASVQFPGAVVVGKGLRERASGQMFVAVQAEPASEAIASPFGPTTRESFAPGRHHDQGEMGFKAEALG